MHCTNQLMKMANEFKRIIKRQLSRTRSEEIISRLKIKRADLRNADADNMYKKATDILITTREILNNKNNEPSCHCGLSAFKAYLQDFMDSHIVVNNKIVRSGQKASKAIVETIQILSLDQVESYLGRVKKNIEIAAKYGCDKQKNLLTKALRQYNSDDLIDLLEYNTHYSMAS